jgi:hypothetical protein
MFFKLRTALLAGKFLRISWQGLLYQDRRSVASPRKFTICNGLVCASASTVGIAADQLLVLLNGKRSVMPAM